MPTDLELRQNINAAQRRAHYARGRRDALQDALRLMAGDPPSPHGDRVYRQLSTMLEAARREVTDSAADLDAAYVAYNRSFGRA